MFNNEIESIRKAFPHTTPIMITYIIMGAVFGVMMVSNGYSPLISLLMACIIYAGAMQFVSVSLLSGSVPLTSIIILSLSINARQFFYAIASLRRYGYREGSAFPSWKRYYLMFSVTDETFAILNLRDNNKEKIDYESDLNIMFYISLLNQIYWIIGCVAGNILGNYIAFIQDIKGLDFIVIATFSVLLYENLKNKSNHVAIFIGVVCTMICLFIDRENFLIYSLISIVCILSILQKMKWKN